MERETEANKGQYSVLSLPLGFRVKETSKVGTFARPETPLTFYDKQDCPASRKVREVFSILDLDVLTLPCPEGGATFAPELAQRSPGAKAPFLVDANTGFELADADEIVSYLFCTYGNRQIPLALRPGKLSELTATVGLAPRKGAGGTKAGATRQPALPLEFWAYEASPFCVIVKEVLAELEIPHVQRSCARGSPKRQQLLDGPAGHFQVPYLVDPNAGVAMFESSAIIEYLRTTYGA